MHAAKSWVQVTAEGCCAGRPLRDKTSVIQDSIALRQSACLTETCSVVLLMSCCRTLTVAAAAASRAGCTNTLCVSACSLLRSCMAQHASQELRTAVTKLRLPQCHVPMETHVHEQWLVAEGMRCNSCTRDGHEFHGHTAVDTVIIRSIYVVIWRSQASTEG